MKNKQVRIVKYILLGLFVFNMFVQGISSLVAVDIINDVIYMNTKDAETGAIILFILMIFGVAMIILLIASIVYILALFLGRIPGTILDVILFFVFVAGFLLNIIYILIAAYEPSPFVPFGIILFNISIIASIFMTIFSFIFNLVEFAALKRDGTDR